MSYLRFIFALISCCFLIVNLRAHAATDDKYVITDYGATGDGVTLNTRFIQDAIFDCAEQGGGKVYFPPGKYLSGTLILKSNVTLEIGEGAVLLGSTNITDYPEIMTQLPSYYQHVIKQSLIYGENLENIGIIGRGMIDGQGSAFRVTTMETPGRFRNRPYIIRFIQCKNIRIRDIHLQNSAMWMQHYLACDQLKIENISVFNHCNQNNDMMDIDGCHDVVITGCTGDTDDDALTFKSTSARSCENITVSNCILSSHCNAIKCGTESHGGFQNITITNCIVRPSLNDSPIFGRLNGISAISLEIVDGGVMDGINISGVVIEGTEVPLFIRLGNRARKYTAEQSAPDMGVLRNLMITNVAATSVGKTGCSISGLAGHPVQNIIISGIRISFAGGRKKEEVDVIIPELEDQYPEAIMFGILPAYGFFIRHAENIHLENIMLQVRDPEERIPLIAEDAKQLKISGMEAYSCENTPSFIRLVNCKDAVIHENYMGYPAQAFLEVIGPETKDIRRSGNFIPKCVPPIKTLKDIF